MQISIYSNNAASEAASDHPKLVPQKVPAPHLYVAEAHLAPGHLGVQPQSDVERLGRPGTHLSQNLTVTVHVCVHSQ